MNEADRLIYQNLSKQKIVKKIRFYADEEHKNEISVDFFGLNDDVLKTFQVDGKNISLIPIATIIGENVSFLEFKELLKMTIDGIFLQ